MEGLDSPELVAPTVAAALRFTFYQQADPTSQLLRYLASKQLLLILDNAEHLLEVGALVEQILRGAPRVKIVVTTREALRIRQEWFHPVEGMATGSWETDAVALFAQCARRALPGFDLAQELASVQRICEQVEGAPLAIELAAGWVKVLPCARIAQEIERGRDFLATTLQDVPERHRSMRIVLDQTWDRLTAEERQALARLSVFAGGFGAQAAEQVAEVTLWTLAELADKSVVQVKQDGRYRIHALLRQMGGEKLAEEPREAAQMWARHSAYYLAFLRDRCESIAGREQRRVLDEVQAELDNIRGAWGHAVEQGRVEELGAALPCLTRFLWTRGRYVEGEELTGLALEALDPAELTESGQAVWVALAARRAQFASAHGAQERAEAQLAVALAVAGRVSGACELALCHYVAGVIADDVRDHDDARDHFQTAQRIYRELDDTMGAADTALRLAEIMSARIYDMRMGHELIDEVLPILGRAGDLQGTARALNVIAVMYLHAGELDEAEERWREGLAIAREVGDRIVAAKCIGGLGLVAEGRGEVDLAIQLLLERRARMQDLGHESEAEVSQDLFGAVYVRSGRFAAARQHLETHPTLWRIPYAAMIHVGTGEYPEAIRCLARETATKLSQGNYYDVGLCLSAWAMLLVSECGLVRESGASVEPIALTRPERMTRASEVLRLLGAEVRHCVTDRFWYGRRLAEIQGEPLAPAPGAMSLEQLDPALEALAQEMLTIRLMQG